MGAHLIPPRSLVGRTPSSPPAAEETEAQRRPGPPAPPCGSRVSGSGHLSRSDFADRTPPLQGGFLDVTQATAGHRASHRPTLRAELGLAGWMQKNRKLSEPVSALGKFPSCSLKLGAPWGLSSACPPSSSLRVTPQAVSCRPSSFRSHLQATVSPAMAPAPERPQPSALPSHIPRGISSWMDAGCPNSTRLTRLASSFFP